jgi:hypothetical protein
LKYDTREWAKLTFTAADGSGSRVLEMAEEGLNETRIWERFASAVEGKGEPAVGVKSVLGTMALLDAARKSSGRGTVIDVSGVGWQI